MQMEASHFFNKKNLCRNVKFNQNIKKLVEFTKTQNSQNILTFLSKKTRFHPKKIKTMPI
jgi:hypothetical protein